ncbi:hypothetical protein K0M31_009968 [Melipona bicolor]|uniref:Uncharacterized protein n=1 Tax=Melipona bicolor TaxID=60889 RepID=A0AA40FML7_9HYME|nr:hypothetical protein K0M31_009968 [Melipona bicolor]
MAQIRYHESHSFSSTYVLRSFVTLFVRVVQRHLLVKVNAANATPSRKRNGKGKKKGEKGKEGEEVATKRNSTNSNGSNRFRSDRSFTEGKDGKRPEWSVDQWGELQVLFQCEHVCTYVKVTLTIQQLFCYLSVLYGVGGCLEMHKRQSERRKNEKRR